MAEVWRARLSPGGTAGPDEPAEVALKRLMPEHRAEAAMVDLFVQEGKLAVRLNHPNLVRTYKVFKKGSDYFMVQELVRGRSLAALSERAQKRGIPLGVAAAVFCAHELVKGLEALHKMRFGEGAATVVHADVNPGNVLVSRRGEVKLIDFGVAMAEGTPSRGPSGSVRGTLAYMPPEQVLGKPLDKRADLFAAGLVLWEMLANRRHSQAPSEYEAMQVARACSIPLLSTVRTDLPELLVQIVRKALFADPALRFQSAVEFLNALEVLARRANLALTPETLAAEAA
jgi:serine/threonine-protein kinase